MQTTGRFELPLIMPSQAQKHVTHNEALTLLDGLIHLVITASGLTAPPLSAVTDDAYLVGSPAAGAWFGQEGKIALNSDAGWRFTLPVRGMTAFFVSANELRIYEQGVWTKLGDYVGALNYAMLGVNTSADATNRFALRSNAALMTALEAGAGGNGDIQVKINKESGADTASLLFQSAFSGRAEIGLTGDDDFHFKVSANGSAFFESLWITRSSGLVTVKNGFVLDPQSADPASPVNGLVWFNSTTGSFRARAGSANLTLAGLEISQSYAAGARQRFSASSTAAGFNLTPGAGDPTGAANGDIWYNSTLNAFRKFQNGAASNLDTTGSGAFAAVLTANFAVPASSAFFDFALPGAGVGQLLIASVSLSMPGGLSEDEIEFEPIAVSGRVASAGNVRLHLASLNGAPVFGQRNIILIVQ